MSERLLEPTTTTVYGREAENLDVGDKHGVGQIVIETGNGPSGAFAVKCRRYFGLYFCPFCPLCERKSSCPASLAQN